ncbi:hypothetical protein [Arsenicibacter rosenii]|uniref:Uncharacterized protein n=1 Tax=Arsenicibacter rosenii TaxID=1750698 RepID=A0A1S2VB04_9BACT|nr:hypothetical protein [Arsenicibacter rosenii]OIN55901.1 hypothetical protein BLX24_27510 [Arsenicibacter rosenii]
MKNNKPCVGLLAGKGSAITKEVCQQLAEEGITAIVREKKTGIDEPATQTNDVLRQLRGEPGKDLFFNGWKLLF